MSSKRTVFVSGVAGLAAVMCGCTTTSTQPPPNSYDSAKALQDQRQTYFHAWLSKADNAEREFFACVQNYAGAHHSSSLTATEIAIAAVSACNSPLADFRNDEHAAYSLINNSDGYAEADRAVAQISDRAKGLVIRQIAEKN